jgi:hypothetical protein
VDNKLLTQLERDTVDMLGQVHMNMCTIVADGPTRMDDLTESCHHVHVLQRMIMGQAAARAYPDHFRLLGSLIPGTIE